MPSSASAAGGRRRLGYLLVAGALGFVFFATLLPGGDPIDKWTFWCVFCGDHELADTLANIVLFAPVGVALGLLGWRVFGALGAGAALSVAVELAQLFIPGRWSAIGDVIFNGLGAAIGCLIVVTASKWLSPPERKAPWLSLAAGLGVAAVFLATAYLLAPAYPLTTYWGQWTPDIERLKVYHGEVLDARVGPLFVPPLRLQDSDSIRTLLLQGEPLQIVALAGPPPPGLASLMSIAYGQYGEILLIGPDQDDLVLDYRTRARALQLSHRSIRLERWLAAIEPGDTLRVSVQRSLHSFCITLNERRECHGFTAGDGWTLVHNLEVFPWLHMPLVSATWVLVLAIPFGLWARRHPASVVGGVAAVAALALTPSLTGLLQPTPIHQWLGLIAGIVAGALVGRRFAISRGSHARLAPTPTR